MKSTILIPTDFTIESVKMVKAILSNSAKEVKYELIFLHGIYLSDSVMDTYFLSKRKLVQSLTNSSFEEACAVLKNKYASQVLSIRKDIYSGITQGAFENYIAANTITEAFIPANYQFAEIHEDSFDLIGFIKKSNIKITEIDWDVTSSDRENGNISEIFFSNPVKK